ncbi:MAG: trigger factor [Dehalococcoidia bacterium]|nr:trigger factor [Dehalococcoidia bacterium]
MKLLEHKNENHQEIFKMELEQEELDEALEAAYQNLVKEVDIDGFRKGKAPRDVLERHVGKDVFFNHARKEYLRVMMDEMMVQNKISVYSTPLVSITGREPVVFETTVPLPPSITLGDYNAIKMKPNPVVISGNEVEEVMKQAQRQEAELVATDAPAEMEDIVYLDIDSDIEGTPYIVSNGDMFQLKPNWRFPAPGFAEELVGMKPGDEKEFTIKLPDNYVDTERAGKDINFRIKINDVRREALPELNDELARKLDPESSGIDAVRQTVHDNLKLRAEENENKAFEEKVIDELVEKSRIAFPPMLVENEIDRMVREYVNRVRESTRSEEDFKSILDSIKIDQLREQYKPQAEQRVKRNLVVSKVSEIEKVEAAEAEIDMQITAITAEVGDQVKKMTEQTAYFNKPENREALRTWLIMNKTKQLLTDKAKAD